MGVGKTTLGKMVASRWKYPFVDIDVWISQQQRLSIAEIFAKYGEAYFRKLEFESLKEITDTFKDAIIATGGGFPCHGQNMQIMNQLGTTVYLKANPVPLAKRLVDAKTVRPLIAGKNESQILETIQELLAKRASYYEQADHIVSLNIENTKLKNLDILLSRLENLRVIDEEE